MKTLYLLASISIFLTLLLALSPSQAPKDYPHVRLFILINGNEVPVPANIEGNEISTAQGGVVYAAPGKTLGNVFEEWGALFNEKCLFQYCNEDMRLYVNGIENFDFDNYLLTPGDEIIIFLKTY